MRIAVRISLLAVLAASSACSGWVRFPGLPTQQPPEFKQFQVWSQGRMITLHSVRMQHDTLTGIPTGKPRGCEECRVMFSAGQVDSLRIGGMGRETGYALGGLTGGVVGLVALLAISYGGMR